MKAIVGLLVLILSGPVLAQPPQTDNPHQGAGRQHPGSSAKSESETATPPAAGRTSRETRPTESKSEHAGAAAPAASADSVDETPVVTHHKITVAGKTLEYTATVGQMPIKNDRGETEAHIFYMAYTLDGADSSKRPLTFAFNGGPGSASIWVHMGAMGPRNAKLLDNGGMPPPPFQLIDNPYTWLDQTDLVFIDPVGTGYSRAKTPEIARRLNSVDGDLQSVGEFIRMYITRNDRWLSPLFIAGESYGTFRAAGLAGELVNNGIALNGVVLISTVLDFGIRRDGPANSLQYAHVLPTLAADAWYHHKLSPDLQRDLRATLKEVENWANTDYLAALNKGDDLTPLERKAIIEKLARYTSLEPRDIEESDLRIDEGRFVRELLRDKKLLIGQYDGRLTGPAPLGDVSGEFDPSGSYVRPPITAAFAHYIRNELGYKIDMEYNVLGGIMSWDWGRGNHEADTTSLLRNAFVKNPHLKVMVCAGYYDVVTPFAAVEYTFHHMGLHPEMQKNVSWQFYEAGHMMSIDREQHAKLKRDVAEFINSAVPRS
jgi:carboxypeptidase C (cathepsin A)